MTTTNRHSFILGSLYSIYYTIYYRFSNIQFIKPDTILSDHIFLINVREYLRGNQTWTSFLCRNRNAHHENQTCTCSQHINLERSRLSVTILSMLNEFDNDWFNSTRKKACFL